PRTDGHRARRRFIGLSLLLPPRFRRGRPRSWRPGGRGRRSESRRVVPTDASASLALAPRLRLPALLFAERSAHAAPGPHAGPCTVHRPTRDPRFLLVPAD